MTQNQYNRAIEINNRLHELETFRDKLRTRKDAKLNYTYYDNIKYCHVVYTDLEYSLRDIFIRHDKMIREEIENEIKSLKDEIKTL